MRILNGLDHELGICKNAENDIYMLELFDGLLKICKALQVVSMSRGLLIK